MKCPFCGSFDDQVIDSRPHDHSSAIRRRRECVECHKRFTTYERPEETFLSVVKSDQRREPFDREKLRRGIMTACEKRPISSDAIEKIVSEVEYALEDCHHRRAADPRTSGFGTDRGRVGGDTGGGVDRQPF